MLHVVCRPVGRQWSVPCRTDTAARQPVWQPPELAVRINPDTCWRLQFPRAVLLCAGHYWLYRNPLISWFIGSLPLLDAGCSVRGCLNLPPRGDSRVGPLQVSGLTAVSSSRSAAIRMNELINIQTEINTAAVYCKNARCTDQSSVLTGCSTASCRWHCFASKVPTSTTACTLAAPRSPG